MSKYTEELRKVNDKLDTIIENIPGQLNMVNDKVVEVDNLTGALIDLGCDQRCIKEAHEDPAIAWFVVSEMRKYPYTDTPSKQFTYLFHKYFGLKQSGVLN